MSTTITTARPKPAAPVKSAAPVAPDAAPAAPVAPGATVDNFRECIAAASIAGGAKDGATATLKQATLTRYRVHAAKLAKSPGGFAILPDNLKREVSARVWQDAGHGSAPKSKDRTPGETSLGQYLSRFGTVASDWSVGMAGLESVEVADAHYQAISDERSADKSAAAHRAMVGWKNSLPPVIADALRMAYDALTTGDGTMHAAAWVAEVNADLKRSAAERAARTPGASK